jgi:DNA-binding GntR family transcriptional regulator
LYGLAKQIAAGNSAREHFEYDGRFWDILFEKARRPVLWEMFTRLDDRMTRYYQHFQKLFPTPESRSRQREVLIELYRNGKIAEAVRAFRKLYQEVVDQFIDHLRLLRCFLWVVSVLGDVWDSQVELSGSVVGGGSKVDKVFESPSHSLC